MFVKIPSCDPKQISAVYHHALASEYQGNEKERTMSAVCLHNTPGQIVGNRRYPHPRKAYFYVSSL